MLLFRCWAVCGRS